MYPAGLTCRVGGRPDGGKDPTCPLWRGITTHNNIIIIMIIIDNIYENEGVYILKCLREKSSFLSVKQNDSIISDTERH